MLTNADLIKTNLLILNLSYYIATLKDSFLIYIKCFNISFYVYRHQPFEKEIY